LITITLAFGTTALLKSVMRPVRDAFVDWARRENGEARMMASASVITAFRDAREKEHVAMREESAIGKSHNFPGLTSTESIIRLVL
jgi:hypothetical protein